MSYNRVVVTGLGAVSPLGETPQQMWQSIHAGRCGIDNIKAFDSTGFECKLAGEVPPYQIRKHLPKSHRKAAKLMCRDIELAVIATEEAINDAALITRAVEPEHINLDPTRTAINLGAGFISCDLVELAPAVAESTVDGKFNIKKWGNQGLEMVTPLWLLKYLPNMLACHIGIIYDIQGPSNSITCGESSALMAVAEAAQIIARGDSDLAVAGGAEAQVNPITMTRQCLFKRAVIGDVEDPKTACRPFDAEAGGSVFGEGAGILILENMESAKKRGAKIYAEIAGAAHSNSINPALQHIEPDGKGLQIAIEDAMDDAQIKPEQLDLLIPHGTGIAVDDVAESLAIEAALKDKVDKIPALPTKSMLSNTGAACGALDTIIAALAMRDRNIPASKNCENKRKECKLNIPMQPLRKDIKYALCCSYTYGGQTSALILKKVD